MTLLALATHRGCALQSLGASGPHRQAHARDAGEEDRVERQRQGQVVGGAQRPVAQLVEVKARCTSPDPAVGSWGSAQG